jgi:hypothetical protein
MYYKWLFSCIISGFFHVYISGFYASSKCNILAKNCSCRHTELKCPSNPSSSIYKMGTSIPMCDM